VEQPALSALQFCAAEAITLTDWLTVFFMLMYCSMNANSGQRKPLIWLDVLLKSKPTLANVECSLFCSVLG